MGALVGNVLPAVPVTDCDGVETTLRAVSCGAPLTLLDVGSAAFSRCINDTERYVSDPEFAALKEAGLKVVQVFTTDQDFQPATPSFCQRYVGEHAIDFTFVIDPLANSDGLSAVHPLVLILNEQAMVVERWVGDPPDDAMARLRNRLDL